LSIAFTIAKFHPIDFSKSNFSKSLVQDLDVFLFNKGPLQLFLLSYFIKPSLNDCVAISWIFKFTGVLILNPSL
jgi:hypothetical protein